MHKLGGSRAAYPRHQRCARHAMRAYQDRRFTISAQRDQGRTWIRPARSMTITPGALFADVRDWTSVVLRASAELLFVMSYLIQSMVCLVPPITHTIQARSPIACSHQLSAIARWCVACTRDSRTSHSAACRSRPRSSKAADRVFLTTCVVDQNSAGSSASKVAAAPAWDVGQGDYRSAWRNDGVVNNCANVRMVESSGPPAILQWAIWLQI